MSPTPLVAVVLLYTLFLLASVTYGYLLGFGDTLTANPYVLTLTSTKDGLWWLDDTNESISQRGIEKLATL